MISKDMVILWKIFGEGKMFVQVNHRLEPPLLQKKGLELEIYTVP